MFYIVNTSRLSLITPMHGNVFVFRLFRYQSIFTFRDQDLFDGVPLPQAAGDEVGQCSVYIPLGVLFLHQGGCP